MQNDAIVRQEIVTTQHQPPSILKWEFNTTYQLHWDTFYDKNTGII